MSEVSAKDMKIMCENTLKFITETRPENDTEESEIESAIWDMRAKAQQAMNANTLVESKDKVFVGIMADKKLFFESTGNFVEDELKQREITELFHKLINMKV